MELDVPSTLDQAIVERECALAEAMRLGTQKAWDRYDSCTTVVDALVRHAKVHNVTRAPWQRCRRFGSRAANPHNEPRKPIETISALVIYGFVAYLALLTILSGISGIVTWVRGW